MASNNISAKRNARGVLKAPSLKRRPLRAPSSNQSEGSLFHVEAEESLFIYEAVEESPFKDEVVEESLFKGEVEESLLQSLNPSPQSKSLSNTSEPVSIPVQFVEKRAESSASLESRLFQLIDEGTIKIDDDCVVWIDEMGLPRRKGLTPSSRGDLERPRPSIFAGKDADVTAFEDEIRSGRILWRQPAFKKEDGEGKTATKVSLFDLILTELKSLPRITHLAWKELLHEFEIASESDGPYSEQMTADRVRRAIAREEYDFEKLETIEKAFKNIFRMTTISLGWYFKSIYWLAGVDPNRTDSDAALENMGEGLGRNVSEVMRLAKLLQQRMIPPDRLVIGAEALAAVATVLRAGQMGPLMNSHLVSHLVSMGF
ncbi:hypothetical protein V8C42DRAFT_357689 [Trichoderma barbatum]